MNELCGDCKKNPSLPGFSICESCYMERHDREHARGRDGKLVRPFAKKQLREAPMMAASGASCWFCSAKGRLVPAGSFFKPQDYKYHSGIKPEDQVCPACVQRVKEYENEFKDARKADAERVKKQVAEQNRNAPRRERTERGIIDIARTLDPATGRELKKRLGY